MKRYKNFDPVREIKRTLMFYGFWIGFIVLIFLLASCESTKHLDKSSSSSEEVKNVDSSSYWKQKYDELKITSEEEKKEFQSSLQFHEENTGGLARAFDEVQDLFLKKGLLSDSLGQRLRAIFDSLKHDPCRNGLTTHADGSFTATGLRSADLDAFFLNSKLVLTSTQLQEEKTKTFKLQQELKAAQAEKHVVKETKIMTRWWMWFLAGAAIVLAIWIYISWRVHKAKKLASLETYYRNAKI